LIDEAMKASIRHRRFRDDGVRQGSTARNTEMILVTLFNSVVRFIAAAHDIVQEAMELRAEMAKRYPHI
jgi:hypothetical protein